MSRACPFFLTLVIPSKARNLQFARTKKLQIPRFARDDKVKGTT
jgi:hypothetical protein